MDRGSGRTTGRPGPGITWNGHDRLDLDHDGHQPEPDDGPDLRRPSYVQLLKRAEFDDNKSAADDEFHPDNPHHLDDSDDAHHAELLAAVRLHDEFVTEHAQHHSDVDRRSAEHSADPDHRVRRRRRHAALLPLLMLLACGIPDAADFDAKYPVPVSSTEAASPASPAPHSTDGAVSVSEDVSSPTSSAAPKPATTAVIPWGMVSQADIDRAASLVATLTPPQLAGAVIMASSADAVGTTDVADLELGGVIMMGSRGLLDGTTSGTPAQVEAAIRRLAAQAPLAAEGFPLLVATDQEYGTVTRLVNGFTDLPSASELGGIANLTAAVEATRQAAEIGGAELAAVGVNVDFAPVSDLLPLGGTSQMAQRSYGSDPERTASLVAAAVTGYQSAGVAATLKHFPGIGELTADTHVTLATLAADCVTWNRRASVPIRGGITAGAALVMTGHALFPAVDEGRDPTSLSPTVVTELLRKEPDTAIGSGCTPLAFRGIAVTDSLQMAPIVNRYGSGGAAWRALAAGQDLLLMPVNPAEAVDGIAEAITDGSLAVTRLNEAAVRVFALRSALRGDRPALATVNSAEHRAAAARVWAAVG